MATVNLEYIDQFMVELTRFCNMECTHCIRGDRQRMRIKREYIDTAFERIAEQGGYVSTLMITGGEPALALDLFEYLLDSAKEHGVTFGNFWMATNGTVTSKRFFDLLERAFTQADDGEINGLRVSVDPYHDGIDIEPFQTFAENMEWQGVRMYLEEQGAPKDERLLISDGRAFWNHAATRQVKHDLSLLEDGRMEGTLYLNARGNIISTCDISYERMDDTTDEFIIGGVDNNWQTMLESWFDEHPELISD